MLIGERIKTARIKKKYSQTELGKLTKVSKVSICGYEKGTRIPNLVKFESLVTALDVTPSYLLGLEVNVIEENSEYKIKMSKEDIKIVKELKKHPELYNKVVEDPARSIELISRRVK